MARRGFEKLIDDVKKELKELENEINSLPEINLLTSFFLWIQHSLNSSSTKNLYNRLDKLEAKTKTAIDTHFRGSDRLNHENITEEIDGVEQSYFLQLMQILEKITILEKRLQKKDFQKFLDNL